MSPLYIIGTGGHAKSVSAVCRANNIEIGGYISLDGLTQFLGKKVYNKVEEIEDFVKYDYFIAVGDNKTREKVFNQHPELHYISLIHPSSVVVDDSMIGVGTVIMANTVINAEAKIGDFVIINSGAVVEHECSVGDFCHVSVNATMAGQCKIGNNVFLGAGSTMKQCLSIVDNVTVGINGAVVKDIVKAGTYVGVPCKEI